MAASQKTVEGILDTLELHLEYKQIEGVLLDLAELEGNKSYHDTVSALQVELSRRREKVKL